MIQIPFGIHWKDQLSDGVERVFPSSLSLPMKYSEVAKRSVDPLLMSDAKQYPMACQLIVVGECLGKSLRITNDK